MNNRYKLWFHSYMYMYRVHDYRYGLPHRATIHLLSCGQRLWKSSYECNAFTADLKIAFDTTLLGNDDNTHPER